MRVRFLSVLTGAWLAALAAPPSASGTTFVLADERDLTRQSAAVVIGRVARVDAAADVTTGGVTTSVAIEPGDVVSGALPPGTIVLREAGGELPDRGERLYGAAEYAVGEHVLVFLSQRADGTFRTTSMAMGKYSVGTSGIVTRTLGPGVAVLDPSSARLFTDPSPQSYRLDALVASIRAAASSRETAAAPPIAPDASALQEVEAPFAFLGSPSRWFEPDTGDPVAYPIDSTGDTTLGAAASQAAIDDALAAWTSVSTANLILADGGLIAPVALNDCSINHIVFNDPFSEIDDPAACHGILAVGGYCSSAETRAVNGVVFRRIAVGKVVFNNGWGSCPFWNTCNLAEVATHELGHTIGIGHSQDSAATMAAYAHFDGRCAGLRSDDVSAVGFIYPSSAPTHDSLVLPRAPIQVAIPAGESGVATRVAVKVRNADAWGGGDVIALTASGGDCPQGTVGTPDFGSGAAGAPNTTWVGAGMTRRAVLPLNILADAFTTADGKTPHRCTLTLSTSSTFPGNTDPVPENNSVMVELNVVDRTDKLASAVPAAVHQSFIKSRTPTTIKVPRGESEALKTIKVQVGNADAGEPDGHDITVTAQDGDCPVGTVGVVDFAAGGVPNQVTVTGGAKRRGHVQVRIDPTQFTTAYKGSPTRCTALLTATGPGGDTDATNDITRLVIDVIDDNDL